MSNIRSKNRVNGIIHTINGFTGTQNEICEHFGFKKVTIYRHMNKFNKSFEDTIYYYLENGVEERSNSTFNINGIVGCKKELCRYFDVAESSIHSRMKRCNETFEDALINFIKDNSINNKRKNRIINVCNDSGTINELCNKYNLKYNTVSRYANRHNITFEKSLEIHILNKINSKES